jgi:hypothetical protein
VRILIGADPDVDTFVAIETGDPMYGSFRTIAIRNGQGRLVAGLCLNNYTGNGIELSGAGKAICLRSARQKLCDLVFGFLGCRRMSITVRKSNKRMRALAPRLGFKFEGIARAYYGNEDGLVLSLLINEAIEHGHWTPMEASRGSEAA